MASALALTGSNYGARTRSAPKAPLITKDGSETVRLQDPTTAKGPSGPPLPKNVPECVAEVPEGRATPCELVEYCTVVVLAENVVPEAVP